MARRERIDLPHSHLEDRRPARPSARLVGTGCSSTHSPFRPLQDLLLLRPPSGRSNGLRKATGPSLRRAALQTDRCPLKSCDRGGGGVGGGTGNSIRRRRRRRPRRPRRRDACSMIGAWSLGRSVGRSVSAALYICPRVCDFYSVRRRSCPTFFLPYCSMSEIDFRNFGVSFKL